MNRKYILATVAIILLICFASVATFTLGKMQNYSDITTSYNVGVYDSRNCTNRITTIEWPKPEVGTENVTLFIRNEGTANRAMQIITYKWTVFYNPHSSFEDINRSKVIYVIHDLSPNFILTGNEVAEVHLFLTIKPSVKIIDGFTFSVFIGPSD
jgi:hypothetical protein